MMQDNTSTSKLSTSKLRRVSSDCGDPEGYIRPEIFFMVYNLGPISQRPQQQQQKNVMQILGKPRPQAETAGRLG